MWYCGSGNKKNGVGIISKKEHVERVVELWRVTDRMICLKMELDCVMLNAISAYAPQVGCICEGSILAGPRRDSRKDTKE